MLQILVEHKHMCPHTFGYVVFIAWEFCEHLQLMCKIAVSMETLKCIKTTFGCCGQVSTYFWPCSVFLKAVTSEAA